MKRSYVFLLIFLFAFIFSGCSKTQNNQVADNMNYYVAKELESIDGVNSLEPETIKALSVVIRTNIKNGTLSVENINSNGDANEKLLSLTNQTSDEVLLNNNDIASASYSNEASQMWETQIKKSDILEFFNKHNVSLANISKIVPVFDSNKNLVCLDVCGKQIPYETLREEFNLKSNKITSIENNISSIKITGTLDGGVFNIENANELSLEGKNYREILKSSFETYNIG